MQLLIHVAETESMSYSAECLYMPQQGLSHAIRRLEKELGGPLFHRNGNKIALTTEGEKSE
ncbi:MAG: LysR family transcriptional regulator [Dehalobacterium sp.]